MKNKNKKLTYAFIPVVIAIWGYVFYNLFGSKGSDDKTINFRKVNPTEQISPLPLDSFSILADYRDPFLGNMVENENRVKTGSGVAAPVIKGNTPWPKVTYFGRIKNQTNNKQLILIQINGKQRRMQLNQETDGITLMKISRDSVQVKFNKELKYIKR